MLASAESEYVLENPKNVPLLQLYKEYLRQDKLVTFGKAVPGSKTEGHSPVYRNATTVDKLKKYIVKGTETVHSVFEIAAREHSDSPCFKYRPYDYTLNKSEDHYVSLSFKEVETLKNHLGAGIIYQLSNNPYKDSSKYETHRLIDNHIKDYKKYDHVNHSFIVTIYCSNRYEWLLTDLACASYSITDTALYDTLGPTASEFILDLTQSPIVVCSKQHVKTIIDLKKQYPDKLGSLISVVCVDPLFHSDKWLRDLADDARIKLVDFKTVIALGEIFPVPCLPPRPETLYTISFTSGTSGSNPKGVSLLHSSAASSLCFIFTTLPITKDAFSFLPYAHIFERETVIFTLACGSCVILPQLNYTPLTLFEDLKLSKPTRISLVPRVYNKMEAAIKNATINNPEFSELKKGLFKGIFENKISKQLQGDPNEGRHFIYDRLIINKIKLQFGFENLEYAITGSAPIHPDTVTFLRGALQVGIAQGYGLTETFAGFALSQPYDEKPGHSGPPGTNAEVKLRDIPEMGYSSSDKGGPRGELLVRCYQNFIEYYKFPKETAECIDSEGWFHTGDIARIESETGRITIIDRVKNFFKLSQGEFISPEFIENNYQTTNSIVGQMFCYGDSLKTYVVGILGIDKPSCINFLASHCGTNIDSLTNATDEEVLKLINQLKNRKILINYLNGRVQLKGFEKIKNLYVEFEPLTLARDVVTPTMKLKRPVAKKFFNSVINDMYTEGQIVKESKL